MVHLVLGVLQDLRVLLEARELQAPLGALGQMVHRVLRGLKGPQVCLDRREAQELQGQMDALVLWVILEIQVTLATQEFKDLKEQSVFRGQLVVLAQLELQDFQEPQVHRVAQVQLEQWDLRALLGLMEEQGLQEIRVLLVQLVILDLLELQDPQGL